MLPAWHGQNRIRAEPAPTARATAVIVAPWMDWMRQHRGEIQQTSAKPTPFTESIFKHTTYGPLNRVTPSSCAATVCAHDAQIPFSVQNEQAGSCRTDLDIERTEWNSSAVGGGRARRHGSLI